MSLMIQVPANDLKELIRTNKKLISLLEEKQQAEADVWLECGRFCKATGYTRGKFNSLFRVYGNERRICRHDNPNGHREVNYTELVRLKIINTHI